MLGSIRSRVLGFAVCIAAFVAVAMATANFFRIESALMGVGTVVLAALAAFLFSRRLIGSIDNLTQTMDLLAEGRTDMVVGHRERRDEIGAMARAVETIRESKAKVDRMIEDDRLSLERRQAADGTARPPRRQLRTGDELGFSRPVGRRRADGFPVRPAGRSRQRHCRLGFRRGFRRRSIDRQCGSGRRRDGGVVGVDPGHRTAGLRIVGDRARFGRTGRADQRDRRGPCRRRQPDRRDRSI